MDFIDDMLGNGRDFQVLNVVDDYSREMVDEVMSTSISDRDRRLVRFSGQLIDQRDKPIKAVCEIVSRWLIKALCFWSKK